MCTLLHFGLRLVVACHACQHLAREIVDCCLARKAAFAVCPCCPKDPDGSIQAAATAMGVDFSAAMILAEMGRVAPRCRVALRMFDSQISPHNRILFGRLGPSDGDRFDPPRSAQARQRAAGLAMFGSAGPWHRRNYAGWPGRRARDSRRLPKRCRGKAATCICGLLSFKRTYVPQGRLDLTRCLRKELMLTHTGQLHPATWLERVLLSGSKVTFVVRCSMRSCS